MQIQGSIKELEKLSDILKLVLDQEEGLIVRDLNDQEVRFLTQMKRAIDG